MTKEQKRSRCPKCWKRVLIRKDGTLAEHREPRVYRSQHHKLNRCNGSGIRP